MLTRVCPFSRSPTISSGRMSSASSLANNHCNRPACIHMQNTLHGACLVNPRCACAAMVTVVGSVCLCVCVSVKSHLTYRASVRPENPVTYSAGNEGQKICGDFPETTVFKSYAAKHERKSQYSNYSNLPAVSFLCLTYSEAPEGTVNNIQPCSKRHLLMPLARV